MFPDVFLLKDFTRLVLFGVYVCVCVCVCAHVYSSEDTVSPDKHEQYKERSIDHPVVKVSAKAIVLMSFQSGRSLSV